MTAMPCFPVAVLAAVLLLAGPARADHGEEPGDPARGATLTQSCVGCHGVRGRSVIDGFPSLAGQREGYLVEQLRIFRWAARKRDPGTSARERKRLEREARFAHLVQRRRSNPAKDPYMIGLSDQDIRDLAAYYASIECRWMPAEVPPRPPIVERCAVCHGRGGVSRNHMVPALSGQNADYLQNQILALREAGRAAKSTGDARHAGMMSRQAAPLSDDQVVRLSEYYAALPCAAPPQPLPSRTAEPRRPAPTAPRPRD